MNSPISKTNRRKFLGWGFLGLGSLALLLKSKFSGSKEPKKVKLLTHDGTLVEVDVKHLPNKSRKVSNNQLVSWIWKDQKL